MKTIKQQETINFNAISFKDALTMLPLMDELTNLVNNIKLVEFYANLPEEEKNKYRNVWRRNDISLPTNSIEKIYELLKSLGFESQNDLIEPSIQKLELKK